MTDRVVHFSLEISPDEAPPEDQIHPRVKRHQLPMKRLISYACLNRSRFPLKTFSELDLTVFLIETVPDINNSF